MQSPSAAIPQVASAGENLARARAERSPGPEELRPTCGLWWLHPGWAMAWLTGGTLIAAASLSDAAFKMYGAPKYVDWEYCGLGLLGIAAFAAGQWLAKSTGQVPRGLTIANRRRLVIWFNAAALLSIVAYVVWFGVPFLRGGFAMFYAAMTATSGNPHDWFPTTSGVTTCTQFGMAAVVLGMLCSPERAAFGRRRWLLAILFVLAAGRMILVNERLALIELVVPAGVMMLRLTVLAREKLSPRLRRQLSMAPLGGLVAVVVLFGGAEYFRSWRFYQDRFDSFAEFTVWRFSGYYTTAHNNSVMAMKVRGSWPMPYYTLEQFWRFPLVAGSAISYQSLNGFEPEEVHEETLERYGTAELNNQGGLFTPAMDYGWCGYFIYWSLFGFVAGRLHRAFLAGSLAGLLFYPLVFLAILEVPRLLYLSSVRTFPTLVLLGLIVALEARRGNRGASSANGASPSSQPTAPTGAFA